MDEEGGKMNQFKVGDRVIAQALITNVAKSIQEVK